MPTATELSSFNRFILAFWMNQAGGVDNAQAWEQFDASYKQQVLDEYHAAGIALMVSAFGSTGGSLMPLRPKLMSRLPYI